jgi:hypothetical protein
MVPRKTLPNPENASLAELVTAAKSASTQRGHNRFRAIVALIVGSDTETTATTCA